MTFSPSIDPSLPNLPADASEYQRDLDRRLREILSRLAYTVEPLDRYKANAGDVLTVNSGELGGVEWATPSGGGVAVKDEGTTAVASATSMDFVGPNVTVTGSGSAATITVSGMDIWRGRRVSTVVPTTASTTLTTLGEAFTLTGSASGPALATTNRLTSVARYVTTSAAGALSTTGVIGTNGYWLGNAAGLGGFRVESEFGIVTSQTTLRASVGLINNGGFGFSLAGEASTCTECVFMGCDAGDTNMQIMHNDNAGTCTKIDLGSSFPKTANAVYKVVFRATPNASSIDYEVTRLDSAATASGTITTNLPSSTAFMNFYCRFGNGTTAAAVAGAFIRYIGEFGETSA